MDRKLWKVLNLLVNFNETRRNEFVLIHSSLIFAQISNVWPYSLSHCLHLKLFKVLSGWPKPYKKWKSFAAFWHQSLDMSFSRSDRVGPIKKSSIRKWNKMMLSLNQMHFYIIIQVSSHALGQKPILCLKFHPVLLKGMTLFSTEDQSRKVPSNLNLKCNLNLSNFVRVRRKKIRNETISQFDLIRY